MKLFIVCVLLSGLFAVTVNGKSECEKHRERVINHPSDRNIIPECEKNGDYKGKQCHTNSNFCQCWDKDGHPISQPSTQLKACECFRQRDDANREEASNMLGVYIPQCNNDGTYTKKQCWSSTGTCWCVDENGKKTSEPTRDKVDC